MFLVLSLGVVLAFVLFHREAIIGFFFIPFWSSASTHMNQIFSLHFLDAEEKNTHDWESRGPSHNFHLHFFYVHRCSFEVAFLKNTNCESGFGN